MLVDLLLEGGFLLGFAGAVFGKFEGLDLGSDEEGLVVGGGGGFDFCGEGVDDVLGGGLVFS